MRAGRNMILVMLLSGGLAWLAGMAEVAGIQLKLLKDNSPHTAPYGYTAIIIAWLARRQPLGGGVGVAPTQPFLLASLERGGGRE